MPGKCLFSIKFFLVGKAYLRKADASNHNKKNISTVYYFFFLKVYSSHLREKEVLSCEVFLGKKYVVFGSNSLKMLVSFNKNFLEKYYFIVLFLSNSEGVSVVFMHHFC